MHEHPGYEVQTAQRVAKALGHEHEFVPLPASYPLELVAEGSLIGDGMNAFHHAQALYLAETLAKRGVDLLLNGLTLDTLLSDFALPRRHWQLLGRQWPGPWLPPAAGLDAVGGVWQMWSLADQSCVRRLVKGGRLDEALGHAHERLVALLSTLEAGAADPYLFRVFGTIADASCTYCGIAMLAVDRLAPGRRVGGDTEVLDLFFTLPAQHRLSHGLYTSLFSQIDRRCRWVPYSNTELPVSRFFGPWESVAAPLQRALSRALEAAVSRVSERQARRFDRSAWPSPAAGVRHSPEWQQYLRGKVESSRLADMGLVSGDGLRDLVNELIAGRDEHWAVIGTWITLEEWLARYG